MDPKTSVKPGNDQFLDQMRQHVTRHADLAPHAGRRRRVHAETEGNPFFLAEVVRLMSEEGAFAPGAPARTGTIMTRLLLSLEIVAGS